VLAAQENTPPMKQAWSYNNNGCRWWHT